jgi:hypothetical protein
MAAKQANMRLIYSTSSPRKNAISKDLLNSFDLILAGQLASEVDAKHLGVDYIENQEKFTFNVN